MLAACLAAGLLSGCTVQDVAVLGSDALRGRDNGTPGSAIARAYLIDQLKPIATGLNVAQNVGHINVLRIVRESGGCALAVSDEAIRGVIRDEWRARRFGWSPEGAATLAVLPELADRRLIRAGDRVVLVNTAAPEKYLPTIRELFDGGL